MKPRTAVITGGAQGIGRIIAEIFLKNHFQVAVLDIDREAGSETLKILRRLGSVVFYPCDISREKAVKQCMAKTVHAFGGIDVLVNNAAVSSNRPLSALTQKTWERVLAVNLTGPLLCAKHAAPHFKKRKGCIINICSTRALMSECNTEAYSASKGGLLALTHALAVSLGPEIRVNSISPGWIDVTGLKKSRVRRKARLTRADHAQHPAGRVGQAHDIAELALFLASGKSGFVTGANIVADGGMTRKMIYV